MTDKFNDILTNKELLQLQDFLILNNNTLTVAESCTGGLISSYITSNSGSSSVFKGSIVVYSNEIKEQELKVQKNTMVQYGVVSKEVVKQMLDGVLVKFDADYAMAVSGVAGPNGGTKDKPVGTIVIGVKSKKGDYKIDIYHLKGNRNDIQIQSAKIALKKLKNFLF